MQITWLGTACIKLATEASTIVLDPYDREWNPKCKRFPWKKIEDADAVLITHPHFDHFYHTKEVSVATKAPIYVCEKGLEIGKKKGFPMNRLTSCKVGDSWKVGDFQITVYQGKHCQFDLPLIVKKYISVFLHAHVKQAREVMVQNHEFAIGEKDILDYLIEAKGKRILVLGSANLDDNETYPENVDWLIYPYQGRSHMLNYSLRLIEKIHPKAVFLDHFDDAFPPITETMNCEKLVEAVKKTFPEMEIILPGEEQNYKL